MEITGFVILAGGTAHRLGGISKPDLLVGGMRLLDRTLLEAKKVAPKAQIVVVAPESVVVADDVIRVLEDPPFGGPLAGLQAGLSSLTPNRTGLVGLATCDAPLSPRLIPMLAKELEHSNMAGAVPDNGKIQYAHGLYRMTALVELFDQVDSRDKSVKFAFNRLPLVKILDEENFCADIDTWSDVTQFTCRQDL